MKYDLIRYRMIYEQHCVGRVPTTEPEVRRAVLMLASRMVAVLRHSGLRRTTLNRIVETVQRILLNDIPEPSVYEPEYVAPTKIIYKRRGRDPLSADLAYHGDEGYPIGGW